jgi:DNA polymerase I-like protein with 3'-5' exonuclease and polymerase domains
MRPLPQIPEWVKLEHQVAQILTTQELHGWYFDERAAWELSSSLRAELEETCAILRDGHAYVPGPEFTPKGNNKRYGYIAGATFTRITELNPTSRDHIAWFLGEHYGWEPTLKTETGKAVIDEVVLKEVASSGITIAEDFLKCLTITKKLGMISQGVNAWLKLCTTASRVHHHCSVATNTHRCAHRRPNLSQVPSDHDCRQLFKASPGKVMVGADLSGIELRMLAHYLSKWSTEFADTLLTGDIHQVNADRVGVSRRAIKTICYAFLYGAGDIRIAEAYDSSLKGDKAKKKGAEIRDAFVSAIDGLAELLAAIKEASKKGHVKSIDGRPIKVESQHKALNYLLQSGAGVIAKRWMVLNDTATKELDIPCNQLAFIHDELQFETHPNYANSLSACLERTAGDAGRYYNLRVPIAAEAKEGHSWADVH